MIVFLHPFDHSAPRHTRRTTFRLGSFARSTSLRGEHRLSRTERCVTEPPALADATRERLIVQLARDHARVAQNMGAPSPRRAPLNAADLKVDHRSAGRHSWPWTTTLFHICRWKVTAQPRQTCGCCLRAGTAVADVVSGNPVHRHLNGAIAAGRATDRRGTVDAPAEI